MLSFGEMCSEIHSSWSIIVEKLQWNSCGVINDAYHSIACHEASGTGKSDYGNMYPDLTMVVNSNKHLK